MNRTCPQLRVSVPQVIALTMIAFALLSCKPSAALEGEVQTVSIIVIADVKRNGLPLEHSHVHTFQVKWRGRMLSLVAGDAPGRFRGVEDVRWLGKWPYPPTDHADVIQLSGVSFKTYSATGDKALTGKLIEDGVLLLSIEVSGPDSSFEMLYTDEEGHPVPNARLHIIVQSRSVNSGQAAATDENGRLNLNWVEVPFTYYVSFDYDLHEREWLITPDEHRPGRVDFAGQDVRLVRRQIVSTAITFSDRELATALAEQAEARQLVFLLLPLAQPARPLRRIWSIGTAGLNDTARDQLREHGKVWLGEVGGLRHQVVIFSPQIGVISLDSLGRSNESGMVVAYSLDAMVDCRAEKGQLVVEDGADADFAHALILHGYVPHNAIPAIRSSLQQIGSRGARLSGPGWTVADKEGQFEILLPHNAGPASPNTALTVATMDGEVFHVRKSSESNVLALRDSPEDGIVRVMVQTPDGRPLADVAVHLTSVDTSSRSLK